MKNKLKIILIDSLKKLDIDIQHSQIEILNTKNREHGDYSTNIALKFAHVLKISPIEFANKIKNDIDSKLIVKIEIVKPGFINFFLDSQLLVNLTLNSFQKNKELQFDLESNYINYEFVSANPTGYLHIGHARNGIIGDITINLLKKIGNKVVREYYINDAGNQISNLGKSVLYHYVKLNNIEYDITKEEASYNGYEILEYAKIIEIPSNIWKEKSKEQIVTLFGEHAKLYFMKIVKETLIEINIDKFEVFTSEQYLFDSGKVEETIKRLKETDKVFKKDGAIWIKTSEKGDDKDRVLIKNDGAYTYMVADVANHVLKFERNFNKLINVWGSDHHGYEKRIKASCNFLGYDDKNLEVHYISMVKLLRNGEELKMSKRAGTSLTIKEVLGVIDPNLLRFAMISKSREQQLSIDIDEIKTESMSNPYWYIQYANARMNQLINKFNDQNTFKEVSNFKLLGENEKNIIIKLTDIQDIFKQSAKISEPYILWNYLYELASFFHSYYNSSIIISDDKKLSLERINFIIIIRDIFKTMFKIMNMELIEKM